MKQGNTGFGKVFLLLLCMMFVFAGSSHAAKAELDLQRDKPIPAKVLEVIESNVYKLLIYDSTNPRVEVYALIGVKPNGNQAAYDYSVKKLLNQSVFFLKDDNIPSQNGTNYCYLYVDFHISHNEDLIKRGFALADPEQKSAKEYLKYLRSQEVAKSQSLGMFDFSDIQKGVRIININAAGIEQIMEHFRIDQLKASKWFARISGNPINRLAELRALDKEFFSPEIILEYAPSIHLQTDLQTATPYEIASLVGRITDHSRITDQILQYRLFKEKISKEDFIKNLPIPENYRKSILPYLTFSGNYHEFAGEESKVVNVNTANEVQIANALGISTAQAVVLKSFGSRYSYPLRNVEELFKPHFPLNKEAGSFDILSDNIRLYTNINVAAENELRSLFGRISMANHQLTTAIKAILSKRPFSDREALEAAIGKSYTAKIIPYIYFDRLPETNYINLNTAGRDKIAGLLGLSNSQKSQLRSEYFLPSDIPGFLNKYMDRITLYTNLNRAGFDEILNLSPDMTESLTEDIIRHRSGDGYYTLDDVQKLFEKHNRQDTFHKIKRFLILQ